MHAVYGMGSHSMPPPPQASPLATGPAPARGEDDKSRKRKLFGDIPDSKRRKFILVDDDQRGSRVRVRVMLDQVKMDDMPDAHLKINAVFPRSYFSRQEGDAEDRARAGWDDEEDEAEAGTMPTRGKTLVKVPLMEDEAEMSVPRTTKARRNKEIALNELGYRMAWGQPRTFNGRTLFLQRSRESSYISLFVITPNANLVSFVVDAYRNKMRSSMVAAGRSTASSPHLETRPGKRRWLERMKEPAKAEREDSP